LPAGKFFLLWLADALLWGLVSKATGDKRKIKITNNK
jgi:hypothetical protein